MTISNGNGSVLNSHLLAAMERLQSSFSTLSREVGQSCERVVSIHQTVAALDRAVDDIERGAAEVEANFDTLRDEFGETKRIAHDMVDQAARNTMAISEINATIKQLTVIVSANSEVSRHLQAEDGPIKTLAGQVKELHDDMKDMQRTDTRQRWGIALITLLNTGVLGWMVIAEKLLGK